MILMEAHFETYHINGAKYELFILYDVDLDVRSKLYLPNLKYLQFRFSQCILSVYLNSNVFRDFFCQWADNLVNEINDILDIEEKIVIFNKAIKELVLIGQRQKLMSKSEVLGMYGELFFLKSLLSHSVHELVLNAWQRPAPALHDFDFEDHSLEIKSVGRSANGIKISSIDQLNSLPDKELYLCCMRFSIEKSGIVDSLGVLYNEIIECISPTLRQLFEKKCIESKYAPYAGPEVQVMPYKISPIESNFYFVDQSSFPRLARSLVPESITSIKYEVSIPSISRFITNYELEI